MAHDQLFREKRINRAEYVQLGILKRTDPITYRRLEELYSHRPAGFARQPHVQACKACGKMYVGVRRKLEKCPECGSREIRFVENI